MPLTGKKHFLHPCQIFIYTKNFTAIDICAKKRNAKSSEDNKMMKIQEQK